MSELRRQAQTLSAHVFEEQLKNIANDVIKVWIRDAWTKASSSLPSGETDIHSLFCQRRQALRLMQPLR